MPTPSTPCASQSARGYTFDFLGYVNNSVGATTLYFRVTTTNKKDISYIAFGTMKWTPMAPMNKQTVKGSLGNYLAIWTNDNGEPDFPSFKFQPQFAGFSQGKQDTFSFTVANFNPKLPIQIKVKAGTDKTTVKIPLNNPACNRTPTPTPTPTNTPTATATATPSSPLATPPTQPMLAASQFPTVEVYILDADTLGRPLTEAQKTERWQRGLPVPIATVADESQIPREPVTVTLLTEGNSGVSAATAQRMTDVPINPAVVNVDSWLQKESENLETTAFTPGGCQWTITHTRGTQYAWGRAKTRSVSAPYAMWPAGTPDSNAAPLPQDSPYPENLETWLQCELDQPNATNLLAQFQLWIELEDADDTFAFRLYNVACQSASDKTFLGGLEWKGSNSRRWADYHLYYPNFQSATNKACAEFKFKSGPNRNTPPTINHGPWLDDIGFSSYQKPATSVNCQEKEYTFHLDGAPGDGNVSKGIVLPPYADDFSAGIVDNPANDLDIAGMVSRLKAAGVQSVRLEFMVHPSTFMNSAGRLGDPLNTVTPYQIDLRHYDRVIDMLCANQIAVLGLLDYQTLQRQDWKTNFAGYKNDFVAVSKQLATYFKDRIRYWEIWNEPNYTPTGITAKDYASLLIDTYDTIKVTDLNDKVLFAGLAQTGQKNPGNSFGYLADVSSELANNNRQNPAPYDIFALHPYPSDDYKDPNDKVVLDPSIYLRWEQPTTINKFFATMTKNGKANQPIWITEIGWNRAVDSHDPATFACAAINTTMVNGTEQAFYALQSFTILYQETGWDANTPVVTKIFWYQYMDTGVSQTICNQATSATVSPSWSGSYLAQSAAADQAQASVNWWFGLYQGINWNKGGAIDTNPVQCIFRKYPFNPPDLVYDCLPTVYLPVIQTSGVTVSGQ